MQFVFYIGVLVCAMFALVRGEPLGRVQRSPVPIADPGPDPYFFDYGHGHHGYGHHGYGHHGYDHHGYDHHGYGHHGYGGYGDFDDWFD